MSWFKNAFKAVGKAVSGAAKVVKAIAPSALSMVASMIPVVGPVASSLVQKLIPDHPADVQQEVQEIVMQAAASPVSTPQEAIAQAAQVKQSLISAGVAPEQASSIGAVVKVASEAPHTAAPDVLHTINSQLTAAPLAQGFTKEDIKTIAAGALEGVKNGAVDAYLDKTEDGKATKAAAIESQGNKILPYILLAGAAFLWFKRK